MSHELFRLQAKLNNTPHLVSQASFESIVNYLTARNEGKSNLEADDGYSAESDNDLQFNKDTGVGFLSIQGPLTYKPIQTMCAGPAVSYQSLVQDTQALADAGAKIIVMDVDSGGGEAYACFESANVIREICDANGITLLAYVDGTSASAAYGLTCVADEIVMNPNADAGSIGVVVRLMNDSKALEKAGYERTFVYAGDSKVPFAEDGSFREDFLADIQGKVDALYSDFVEHVSNYREMSTESVQGTQAKTFFAKDALELGLADKQMTRLEFFDYLADIVDEQTSTQGVQNKMLSKTFKLSNKEVKPNMLVEAQLAEMQEKLVALEASAVAHVAEMASLAEMLAGKEAQLAEALGALAEMQAEKAQAQLSARKEKLAAVIGTAALDETFSALAGLSDESFDVVLKGMSATRVAEAKTEMFDELGAKAEAESGKNEPELSEEAKILRAKYGSK